MDFSQVRQTLRKAEDELISLITETDDFSEREQCLELAKQVRELADLLRQGENKATADQPSPTSSLVQVGSSKDESELPAYFIHEGLLYKVGLGGDGRRYKKTVPLDNVSSICDVIAALLSDSNEITTSSIKRQLDAIPDYRVQVVVMALVKTGALRTVGRGKYSLTAKTQPRSRNWVRDLGNLPDRYDLIF